MSHWLESVLCRLLFSSVVIGSVSKSLSMFVFSMLASSSSKVSSVLVVGLDSDGFVFVAEEVVVDILGEELLSVVVVGVIVVIVLNIVAVISLRTLEVVVVGLSLQGSLQLKGKEECCYLPLLFVFDWIRKSSIKWI